MSNHNDFLIGFKTGGFLKYGDPYILLKIGLFQYICVYLVLNPMVGEGTPSFWYPHPSSQVLVTGENHSLRGTPSSNETQGRRGQGSLPRNVGI